MEAVSAIQRQENVFAHQDFMVNTAKYHVLLVAMGVGVSRCVDVVMVAPVTQYQVAVHVQKDGLDPHVRKEIVHTTQLHLLTEAVRTYPWSSVEILFIEKFLLK